MLLFLLHLLLLLLLCVALSTAALRGMTDEGEGGCRGWPLEDLEGPPGSLLGTSCGLRGASWEASCLRPTPPPCLNCGSESSWMLLTGLFGGLWGAPEGQIRSLLGTFWGPFGGPLGASWERIGGVLGRPGGLLGASWGLGMSVCVPPLGPLLGRSGGSLGPSWRALGLSGGPRGPSRGSLGGLLSRLVAICGAYWAVWERREAEKAETRQSTTHPRDIHDFCFLGPYWECSWRPLGRVGGLLDRL